MGVGLYMFPFHEIQSSIFSMSIGWLDGLIVRFFNLNFFIKIARDLKTINEIKNVEFMIIYPIHPFNEWENIDRN